MRMRSTKRVVPLLMVLFGLEAVAAPISEVRVGELRCEGRKDPAGIDVGDPRLGWQLLSERRGVVQQAYQVLVASSTAGLVEGKADLWDSGKVDSDQSGAVPYQGKPLTSGLRSYWTVRVWDQLGSVTPWSAPGGWLMGLVRPEDWSAEWIGLEEGPHPEGLHPARWIWHPAGEPTLAKPVGPCFFRREFLVPEDRTLLSATVWMAADNQMSIHVNGTRCGASGDYHTASEFNILNAIHPGKNLLAVEASNGGESPNPAGLIGVVRLVFADGERVNLPTDNQWRVTDQPQNGWFESGFDDANWMDAADVGPYGMAPWGELETPDSRELPARMMRRAFDLEVPVQSAVVHMAGLGLSELYLNGRKVGDAVLSPALSEYDKRVYYVTYDVTSMLKKGANALGVWLGNGRYYAPRGISFVGMKSYGYPKLLLQLDIRFADGGSRRIVSDSEWIITTEGPIRTNNEYDGEAYDSRLEIPAWCAAGFDDRGWKQAGRVPAPTGVLTAQDIDPIRVTETLKPISVHSPGPGVHVFDMGQNMVGWVRLRVRGARGTAVTLRFAETTRDGNLYYENLRGAKCMDTYILKGEGEEIYEPRFTYHGFRYVEVRGFPGEPDLSALEGRVVHDDLKPVGSFRCSNETLNQVLGNAVWGIRGNYRSVPTDCSQRDERQGWLGDRSEESRGEMSLFDAGRFYAKWVRDMEDSQRETGSVPDVAPPYYPFYTDNVTWPSSFIIIPAILYEKCADRRIIERHYPAMKRWIEFMRGHMREGLMPRDQYGDWCMPPESQELIHSQDPARKTAGPLIATAYFCHDLDLMAAYAALVGAEADAAEYRALAGELRDAFNRAYWNEELGQYDNGTQTSSVLALAFDLVPREKQSRVLEHLVTGIQEKGKGHVGTGLIGCQWLMRVLSEHGRVDVAYAIATRRDYPSWGYMIEQGATTIWELWNGDTADPAMNSHNHVMLLGDYIVWLYEYLAGIQSDPDRPGFKNVVLKPYPPEGLTFVEAELMSMHGPIGSRWRREGRDFIWELTIPSNTAAEVHVPATDPQGVTESGTPIAMSEGVRWVRSENGRSVYAVDSGRYLFRSTMP